MAALQHGVDPVGQQQFLVYPAMGGVPVIISTDPSQKVSEKSLLERVRIQRDKLLNSSRFIQQKELKATRGDHVPAHAALTSGTQQEKLLTDVISPKIHK